MHLCMRTEPNALTSVLDAGSVHATENVSNLTCLILAAEASMPLVIHHEPKVKSAAGQMHSLGGLRWTSSMCGGFKTSAKSSKGIASLSFDGPTPLATARAYLRIASMTATSGGTLRTLICSIRARWKYGSALRYLPARREAATLFTLPGKGERLLAPGCQY